MVQQSRGSGPFEDGEMGAIVAAGTSAESGDRGPGPFIGDFEGIAQFAQFQRVDP